MATPRQPCCPEASIPAAICRMYRECGSAASRHPAKSHRMLDQGKIMARALRPLLILILTLVPFTALAQQTGGSCLVRLGNASTSGGLGVCAPVERWTAYRYLIEASDPQEPPNPPYGYASEQEAIDAFEQKWPDTCRWGPPIRVGENWLDTSVMWQMVKAGPLYFDDLSPRAQTIENKTIWCQSGAEQGVQTASRSATGTPRTWTRLVSTLLSGCGHTVCRNPSSAGTNHPPIPRTWAAVHLRD
jgi:hypothetical protein